mgnify:CR=1 FL=1
MIKIKAKIKTHLGKGRTNPITSGYRPLFFFGTQSLKSGMITLINASSIEIGDESEVYVTFNDNEFMGEDLSIGERILFGEGINLFGEIEILEIF